METPLNALLFSIASTIVSIHGGSNPRDPTIFIHSLNKEMIILSKLTVSMKINFNS
jgi:hypothetical protein